MTEQGRTQTHTTPRRPSTVALAILITLTLLAVAALGWVWFTRYAPLHFDIGARDATITDARAAAFISPLLGLGFFVIALLWVLTWIRMRWDITPLPIIIGTAGVLALVAGIIGLGRAWSGGHEIIVMTYLCEDGAERLAPDAEGLPAGCEVVPDIEGVSIGTADDPTLVRRDESSTSLSRFTDLPPGTYRAEITATARSSTADVILAAEIDGELRAMSPLDHTQGTEWAGTITLHPDVDTYYLLLYPSTFPEAPEASLRFTAQSCIGTSVTDFDADACEPTTVTTKIVEIVPPSGSSPAGRQPMVTIEDDALVFANLEERTYTLAPSIELVGNDLLVIPADDTQTADRNILQQTGAPLGSFEIEVTGETRERAYIVYIIEEGVTFAHVGP